MLHAALSTSRQGGGDEARLAKKRRIGGRLFKESYDRDSTPKSEDGRLKVENDDEGGEELTTPISQVVYND